MGFYKTLTVENGFRICCEFPQMVVALVSGIGLRTDDIYKGDVVSVLLSRQGYSVFRVLESDLMLSHRRILSVARPR